MVSILRTIENKGRGIRNSTTFLWSKAMGVGNVVWQPLTGSSKVPSRRNMGWMREKDCFDIFVQVLSELSMQLKE